MCGLRERCGLVPIGVPILPSPMICFRDTYRSWQRPDLWEKDLSYQKERGMLKKRKSDRNERGRTFLMEIKILKDIQGVSPWRPSRFLRRLSVSFSLKRTNSIAMKMDMEPIRTEEIGPTAAHESLSLAEPIAPLPQCKVALWPLTPLKWVSDSLFNLFFCLFVSLFICVIQV